MTKLPPQNLEAEESILAGCMLFPEMLEEAVSFLQMQDFYKTIHQQIFKSILRIRSRKEPVDLLTVTTDLKNSGIENIAVQIAKISDQPVPSDIKSYVKIVKDCVLLRKTINTCQKTISACYSANGNTPDVISQAQADILNLDDGIDNDTFTTMHDLTMQSVERYEALNEGKTDNGLMTGYRTLDLLIGGFKGSKLIILAARPGIGKTALMCNLIGNMAKQGVKCGVFEIEMDKEELDDRWTASEAGINSVCLSMGKGPKVEHWERIWPIVERKKKWPVLIDDTGGLKIGELKRRARKMKKMGCQIIFIDQLSEIRSIEKKKSIFELNTEHVEEIGFLKKELRIPIVLLAQLNRELEKRSDKKPILSDLKNTGMLEEKADIVLLLYRKHPYTKAEKDENHAELEIVKHRGGPVRNIEMFWHPKTTKFSEIAKI